MPILACCPREVCAASGCERHHRGQLLRFVGPFVTPQLEPRCHLLCETAASERDGTRTAADVAAGRCGTSF